MKIILLCFVFITFTTACIRQRSIHKHTETDSKYQDIELQQLADSLKYDYNGNNSDYNSHIQLKIVSIGKPIIPYLIEKLDDTMKTKKNLLFSQEHYAVGDVARMYIWQIYYNIYWEKYNNLTSLRKYFLNPSEEEIIVKIVPDIRHYYEQDTITIFNKDGSYTKGTNLTFYDYFMRSEKLEMSEIERRKKYKNEFINSLNKILLTNY